ncbi:MAG TPA: mechanosensitive ion channel domain-containing protein [Cellulomonas sp.]
MTAPVTLEDVLVPAAVVVGAVAVALAVAAAVEAVARRIGRHSPLVTDLSARCHRPLRAVLVVVLGWVGLLSSTRPAPWQPPASHALLIVLIAAVAWLLTGLAHVLEDAALRRYASVTAADRQGRRVQTQAQLLRRIAVAVIVVWAVGAALLTFPAVRVVGASVFASAGLLSVVAGLAAQSSLGNLFAGLQLAFTDAIRMDDVVVVQGDVGRIEEITLTYVGVRLWDDRRVILPSSWFTTTPFENWTHHAPELLGTVEMDVDWSVPVDAMRAELDRLLAGSALWDGRAGRLQVTDATGGRLRVRALVSAVDSATLFGLRAEVREGLVAWVVRQVPSALPRTRTQPMGQADLEIAPAGGHGDSEGDGAPPPPSAADET